MTPAQGSTSARPGSVALLPSPSVALERRGSQCHSSRSSLEPVVPLFLELEGQVLSTRLHYPPVRENVHPIGDDVVEEPLVVSDDDRRVLGALQPVDTFRNDP